MRQQAETYLEAWTRKAWTVLYKGERRFRPSAIAISCVLASRRVAGINPILSDRLKEMTLLEECYDDSVYEEIGECYELVCSLYASPGINNSIRSSVQFSSNNGNLRKNSNLTTGVKS